MASHVRVLSILYIVFSALGILAALGVLLVFGGIAGAIGMSGTMDADARTAVPILGLIGGLICIFILVLSIPGIVAGIGLLRYREWARIMTIVLSALELINVPLGTVLGVYGLWVLLNGQTIELFRHPPAPQAAFR